MKTYLMDCFNRYRRFSEGLDVKTILCNKSWWVFNDSGEKEIYIFQEDGTVIVSLKGNVTMANWKYLPVNKSLIINTKEQSYMFHPAFSDNNILALQKDGTEQYSFMIIEEQLNHFQPRTLSELNAYLERQIQMQIEAEQRRLQREEEKKLRLLEEEMENERQILILKETEEKIKNSFFVKYYWLLFMFSIVIAFPILFKMVDLMNINPNAVNLQDFGFCLLVAFIPMIIIVIYGLNKIE